MTLREGQINLERLVVGGVQGQRTSFCSLSRKSESSVSFHRLVRRNPGRRMPRSRSSTRLDSRREKGKELDFPVKSSNGSVSTRTATLDLSGTISNFSEASQARRERSSSTTFFEAERDREVNQFENQSEISSYYDARSRPSVSSTAGASEHSRSTTNHSSSVRQSSICQSTAASRASASRASRNSRNLVGSSDRLDHRSDRRQTSQTLNLDKDETSYSSLSSFGQGPDQAHAFQLDVRRMSMSVQSVKPMESLGADLVDDESISSKGGPDQLYPDQRPRLALDRIPSIRRDFASHDDVQVRRPSIMDAKDDYSRAEAPARRRSFTLLFGVADSRFQKIDHVSPEAQDANCRSKAYSERRSGSYQGLVVGSSKHPKEHPSEHSNRPPARRDSPPTDDSHSRDNREEKPAPQRRPSLGNLFLTAFTGDNRRGRQTERDEAEVPQKRSHSLGTLQKQETSSGRSGKDRKSRRPSLKDIFNPETSFSEKGLLDESDSEVSFHEQDINAKLDAFRKPKSSSDFTSGRSRSRKDDDDERNAGGKSRSFRENLGTDRKPESRHRDSRKGKSSSRGDSRDEIRKQHRRSSGDSHDEDRKQHRRSSNSRNCESRRADSRQADSRHSDSRHHESRHHHHESRHHESRHHRSSHSHHHSSSDEPKEHRRSRSGQRLTDDGRRRSSDDDGRRRSSDNDGRQRSSDDDGRQRQTSDGRKSESRPKSSSNTISKSSHDHHRRSRSRTRDLVPDDGF
jgi:hypothetical protein